MAIRIADAPDKFQFVLKAADVNKNGYIDTKDETTKAAIGVVAVLKIHATNDIIMNQERFLLSTLNVKSVDIPNVETNTVTTTEAIEKPSTSEPVIPKEIYNLSVRDGVYRQIPTIVKSGLNNGADPNLADDNKITLLHIAAFMGDASIVKILIEHKANVNAKNSIGYAPLNSAVDKNNIEVVKLLLEAKADVNTLDKWGYTPLHRAAVLDDPSIALILIKNGAKIDAETSEDNHHTPLAKAVRFEKPLVVKALLDAGANPDKAGETDNTEINALLQAARNKKTTK